MAGILRRLRRSNKKAAKFRFTVTLQELLLNTDETFKPDNLVVSFMHRRRKISSKERKWEQSYSDESRCVIMWPEQMAENIEIITTLYRSIDDEQYEDKEWTIIVEEVTAKGKKKAIAAVPLNVRLFILDLPEHRSELKLKLRPLVSQLRKCSLILLLGSSLIKEVNGDEVSMSSSANTSVLEKNTAPEIPVDEVDAAQRFNEPKIRKTREEIDQMTSRIHQWTENEEDFDDRKILEKENKHPIEVPPIVPEHRRPSEEQPAKIRPQWRVSAEEEKQQSAAIPEVQKRQSRASRSSTEERTSTVAEFKVDLNSRAIPVPTTISHLNTNTGTLPRGRSRSPKAPSRDALPQPIVGETLLAWCQRIGTGYSNVKITDFTKSWKSGLALCSILHTFRPDLIGDYDKLDFSDRIDGNHGNLKKALAVIAVMGISDVPDSSDFLTPDKKEIELLLQKLRRIFEGNFEDATPTSASDHRISKLFSISDAEKIIVDAIDNIREAQHAENAVDYRNIDETNDTPKYISSSKNTTLNQNDYDNDAETSYFDRGNISITMVTPGFNNIRSSGRQASPSKRDEIRKRARDLLEKTSTLPSTPTDKKHDGDEEGRRKLARELMEAATTNGTTFKLTAARQQGFSTPRQQQQQTNLKKLNGSATDLRRVELVRPSVDVHRFRKRDPSPTLVRKQYDPNDTPHLPAIGRSSNSRNDSPFDRVKRYGSMRSAELKESLQQMAIQYGYSRGLSASQEVLNTPSKKLSSNWERDVEDVEGTAKELEKIDERLQDVEQQSKAIQLKIADKGTEKGSSEEETLVDTLLCLTNEKNTLVGRQEYYNIIENIRQTTALIDKFARELDELTKNSDDYKKSADEKNATDLLMEKYKKALDTKSTLVQKLFTTEHDIKEDEERLKNLTLGRKSNFIRGNEQPISASKRAMQWFRGENNQQQ